MLDDCGEGSSGLLLCLQLPTPQEQLLHNSYSITHCKVACGATGGNGNSCVIISSLWKFEFASTGGNGQDL